MADVGDYSLALASSSERQSTSKVVRSVTEEILLENTTVDFAVAASKEILVKLNRPYAGNVWLQIEKTAGDTNVSAVDIKVRSATVNAAGDWVATQTGYDDLVALGTQHDFTDATADKLYFVDLTRWYSDNGSYTKTLGRGIIIYIDDNAGANITATFKVSVIVR